MTAIDGIHAAVVGTGFIGQVHLEAIRRLGVDVAGIVGSSAEKAADVAARWNVRHAYESYEAMLADPTVNVVHITSPNDRHYDQALAALLAGKHVVCEKPLAMTSEETRHLADTAAKTGLVAAVNFNIRFYPQVHEMRDRVQRGDAGRPYLVTGSYLQDWLLYDTDWNWRVQGERGGQLRVVGDVGAHWLDLASFVTGQRITEVFAELSTVIPVRKRPLGEVQTFSSTASGPSEEYPISSEDLAAILLRFEGGALGVLAVSQVSAGRKNAVAIEVSGATYSLAWRGEAPQELWIGHRDKPNEVLLSDPSLFSEGAAAVASLPGGHIEGFENGFKAMYAAVYADIVSGNRPERPAYATFADGHYEALLIEAIGRSSKEGRWVPVHDDKENNR
jgi:predicted dehydrogenase